MRAAAAVLLLLLAGRAFSQPRVAARQVSQSNYTQYLNEFLFTRAEDTRARNSAQHDAARKNIRDTLASFGLEVTEERFEYAGAEYVNITAVLRGKTRPNEYHVIGAHYDAANSPGADDDASGVAALLEAARVASMHDFEASVAFVAFDVEEAGLIGSKAWVAAHAADRIVSMLQLDMIAYNSPGPLHNLIALCVPSLVENAALPVIWDAVQQFGAPLVPVSGGVSKGSDHASFATVAPSVEMIEAGARVNPNYHKPADSIDTPDYIDYEFATAATRAAVGYLARQAGILPDAPRLTTAGVYNAASYIAGGVAAGEIVTLAGSGFGARGAATVRDSAGVERPAPTMYYSDAQINLALPEKMAAGRGTIVVTREDGLRLEAPIEVAAAAPGVFTAAATGLGAPAAIAVRVAADGSQSAQNLFACAAESGCAPARIEFGLESDRVVLLLYGTGIRGRSGLGNVALEIDEFRIAAQYAGAQAEFAGLDQVNVELPRWLRGKGRKAATLRVDGKAANPVTLDLGTPD